MRNLGHAVSDTASVRLNVTDHGAFRDDDCPVYPVDVPEFRKRLMPSPDPNAAPPSADRVRFCIVTTGRTGSTRLRLLLDSHPSIRCHGELFGDNLSTLAAPDSELHGRLVAERMADPAAFLVRRALVSGDTRAVGFKILYGQLTERWSGLLDALRSDHDIRIVHLVRRNGIKRFLSEYFVGTVTRTHLRYAHEPPPAVEPVTIPVASLLADLEAVSRNVQRMRELFREHPFHEIAYEDSLEDDGPAMRELQSFLGVPPAPLSVPIRKILPDDVRLLIANIDEVAAAVRGTPYEPLLVVEP